MVLVDYNFQYPLSDRTDCNTVKYSPFGVR